jgi:hypothetical protein
LSRSAGGALPSVIVKYLSFSELVQLSTGRNLGILKKPLLGDNQLELIMENGMMTQGEGTDPSGFLSEIIGSSVTIKLNSGVVYKG